MRLFQEIEKCVKTYSTPLSRYALGNLTTFVYFNRDLTFSTGLIHNLLLREIHVAGVTRDNKFQFLVDGKWMKFA